VCRETFASDIDAGVFCTPKDSHAEKHFLCKECWVIGDQSVIARECLASGRYEQNLLAVQAGSSVLASATGEMPCVYFPTSCTCGDLGVEAMRRGHLWALTARESAATTAHTDASFRIRRRAEEAEEARTEAQAEAFAERSQPQQLQEEQQQPQQIEKKKEEEEKAEEQQQAEPVAPPYKKRRG